MYLFSGLQQFWKVRLNSWLLNSYIWCRVQSGAIMVFVCAYREKPDSHRYCDDTAHHEWAKRGKRKARSNDIAAATHPKGCRTYQQFLLKTGKYSSWNPLDLFTEPWGSMEPTLGNADLEHQVKQRHLIKYSVFVEYTPPRESGLGIELH